LTKKNLNFILPLPHPPHLPSIFFCSFPDALGTSRQIFKLLGITEVPRKKGNGLMTNRSSFELENWAHLTYLPSFCHFRSK